MSEVVAITAVICTWNRAEQLRGALESFSRQTLPSDRWELIVVDNNSSDCTRQVVGQAQSQYGYELRYVFEPQQGLSVARNTGNRFARAPIIACTDDDCQPEPGWLERILQDFRDPNVSLLGGAGVSVFPPEVESSPARLFLGRRFLGDFRPFAHFTRIGDRDSLIGLNLAYRAEVARALGGFDAMLGNVGKRCLCAEESDFVRRALAAGFGALYDPEAVVYHYVQPERVTWAATQKLAYDMGAGSYRARYARRVEGSRIARLHLTLRFAAEYCYSLARALVFAGSYHRRTTARFRLTCAAGKLAGLWEKNPH